VAVLSGQIARARNINRPGRMGNTFAAAIMSQRRFKTGTSRVSTSIANGTGGSTVLNSFRKRRFA
jgi:hypothetical protein